MAEGRKKIRLLTLRINKKEDQLFYNWYRKAIELQRGYAANAIRYAIEEFILNGECTIIGKICCDETMNVPDNAAVAIYYQDSPMIIDFQDALHKKRISVVKAFKTILKGSLMEVKSAEEESFMCIGKEVKEDNFIKQLGRLAQNISNEYEKQPQIQERGSKKTEPRDNTGSVTKEIMEELKAKAANTEKKQENFFISHNMLPKQ